MEPSSNLYYRVKDLRFDNVIIFLVRDYESYLSDIEINNLNFLNSMYREMVDDVLRLRFVDFSTLKLPRLNYADQTAISQEHANLTTACAIHYGLHTKMVIRYIKGEYVGKSRDADKILSAVTPTSVRSIVIILDASSIKVAHPTSTSKKAMTTSTRSFAKGISKPSSNIPKSLPKL